MIRLSHQALRILLPFLCAMGMQESALAKTLSPSSVAVIGATATKEKLGYSLLSNIVNGGYRGRLYAVNPHYKEVLGIDCYPSILDVPEAVDLAVIIVPSATVLQIVEECSKKGVAGAVIISAGFKEIGSQGALLEKKIVGAAKGMRIIGPNCLGIINTNEKVSLNATFAKAMPRRGNIGFVSQSGALGAAILDYAQGRSIGFSKFVSMGNKADATESDLLEVLAGDLRTDVILLYLEDLVDGRRFMKVSSSIAERKPILVIKSGRTPAGARAAQSHTGALAGSEDAYGAIFAQSGTLRVETMEELFRLAAAYSSQPVPKGNRVAIVTNSGGPGILAADTCEHYGLLLPQLEKKTIEELKGKLSPNASLNNPIDLVADAQEERYEDALSAIMKDRNVDALICILTPQLRTNVEGIARTIVRTTKGWTKPILACFIGYFDVTGGRRILDENGIPNYEFPEDAARTLAAVYEYEKFRERPRKPVRKFAVKTERARKIIEKVKKEGRKYVPELEALHILHAYGFTLPKSSLGKNVEEAKRIARKIGYPVVLKVASPDIIHKFDAGGVELNLRNATELNKAYSRIMQRVKEGNPKAEILGVIVEEMVFNGKETILGMKRDPKFGPLLMLGLGGIYVEVLKDVTFRVAPIAEDEAQKMVMSIKAHKLLEGVRGEKPSDVKSLVDAIQRLSQMVIDIPEIQEIDINPLVVFTAGKGCKALDARMSLQ